MEKWIDLHTHSDQSDGTLSPTELVFHAEKVGLSAIALTDHDTMSGIDKGMVAAQQAGIELVSGVEFSAEFSDEMHILGLYLNHEYPALQNTLAELLIYRKQRNIEMVSALQSGGIEVNIDDIMVQSMSDDPSSIGRIHFAKAMLSKGYVNSIADAFNRFLTHGSCTYVPRRKLSPEACIRLIHDAGGLAILAHPFTVAKNDGFDEILKSLVSFGLDGIECLYPMHKADFEERCIGLCRQYNLLITGGSDFHGDNKPSTPIGIARDGQRISYELLERIKERL